MYEHIYVYIYPYIHSSNQIQVNQAKDRAELTNVLSFEAQKSPIIYKHMQIEAPKIPKCLGSLFGACLVQGYVCTRCLVFSGCCRSNVWVGFGFRV